MLTYRDVRSIVATVHHSLEVSETFSARMCLFREVDETDIQTLDRLIEELRVLRLKEEKRK